MIKATILNQIKEFVENAPRELEEVYKNGSKWYDVRIIGFEFKAVCPPHLSIFPGVLKV